MKVGKFLTAVIFAIIFMAGNCFAMTFSQPEKIGLFCFINLRNGIEILGESHVDEIPNPIMFKANIPYGTKGVEQINSGADALYVHYDTTNRKYYKYLFGGKEINNTFEGKFVQGLIYKISTNSNITLYYIESGYDIPEDDQHTIYGRRADGKFVKYIDTSDLVQKYFGANQGYWLKKLTVAGDVISIYYELFYKGNYRTPTEKGEFRFKWDEAAQWFSVEQVQYSESQIAVNQAQAYVEQGETLYKNSKHREALEKI